jgi:hypothetical protein
MFTDRSVRIEVTFYFVGIQEVSKKFNTFLVKNLTPEQGLEPWTVRLKA